MDFDFTDDQESLRDAVRRWVDKGFGFERRHALAKAGGFTREVLSILSWVAALGALLYFVLLHKPVRPAALRVALGAHWLPVRVAETVAAPSPGSSIRRRRPRSSGRR